MTNESARSRPDPDVARFALAWAKALVATTYVPMAWSDMVRFLHRMAERLVAAMAEPEPSDVGYQIGTQLVAADFMAPEALGRTLSVLHRHLPALAPGADHERLLALTEAVTVAHSRAVRDRALDGQEAVRAAAMMARDHALRELRWAGLHDPLTGLPNRTQLVDRVRRICGGSRAGSGRVAICLVGLDGFGKVNDSLGPRVGDQLLISVAERLGRYAAEAGCQLTRLDGDEFALLTQTTTCVEDAVKLADRALRQFLEPFYVDGHELPIRASVGIVEKRAAGCEPNELLRAAGISLGWAKTDQRQGWAVFEERRNDELVALHRVSAAMPAALQRGEFTLSYQPLVSFDTGGTVGVEALARWHLPGHGVLSPETFIPLAEDTGLIIPLGLALLEQACRYAAAWGDLLVQPPYISVNLSARQIRDAGIVGNIAAVLDRTGLAPGRLQLEITEGTAFNTNAELLGTLNALAGFGIRLAIDDFGTGYANHAILPDLPVHTLKIAGTFVNALTDPPNPRNEAVLANLVKLGHDLNLTVTAEGVETAHQAEWLRRASCDTGQGWHFGRPVAGDMMWQALLPD